jgi:hypothetical protein
VAQDRSGKLGEEALVENPQTQGRHPVMYSYGYFKHLMPTSPSR